MGNLYRIFILAGAILILIGLGLFIMQKLNIPLGKLPGDIVIKKDNFTFYFPLTTSIIISVFLSIILYLRNR